MSRIARLAFLALAAVSLAPAALVAQEVVDAPADTPNEPAGLEIIDGSEVSLADFLWTARPIVVFADSENDPRFVQQMEFLGARPADLVERDVVVITDTVPDPISDVRRELRPRGFSVVLIGKDGAVYLRKPTPWDTRELSRSIDKMPLRQDEMRERRGQ